MLSQESICFAKMSTAKKSTMSWEGRGVRGFEDYMFRRIDERFFLLSVTSPEEEYEEISFFWEGMNHSIGKCFPSFPSVRQGLPSPDGECGIQEEDSLWSPVSEISTLWYWLVETTTHFLKNIHQWWRISDSFLNWKCEAMSLSWTMIGVLTKDDDSYFFKRCHIHRSKYILRMWINRFSCEYFIFYKLRKFLKIWFLKFWLKHILPALMDFYFCHGSSREWRYSSMNEWIVLEVSIGLGMCVMLKSEILLAESLAVRTIILP